MDKLSVHNNQDMRTIASVVVDKALYSFDTPYDYLVPSGCMPSVGQRVIVPFGKGGKKRVGLIVSLKSSDDISGLKEIFALADDDIILNDEMLGLVEWLKENTFCTYFDAVKTVLPGGMALNISEKYRLSQKAGTGEISLTPELLSAAKKLIACKTAKELDQVIEYGLGADGKNIVKQLCELGFLEKTDIIKQRVGDETRKNVRLTEYYLSGEYAEGDNKPLTQKQKAVVDMLNEGCASVKEVCYNCCVTPAVIDNLEKKNVLESFDDLVTRSLSAGAVAVKSPDDITLTDEQSAVYEGVSSLMCKEQAKCALLKGVTGSGKTTVFLKLIDLALSQGKTAMVLVPEIALTPQMVSCFTDLFGNAVAVIHSNLSLGCRRDEYMRIKSGEAKIVVGTRSAVFAPLENIGIIVIDEEGEHTYKSEKSPRYHARDIAKRRCFYHNAVLLLASATPSLDSEYNARIGKYALFEMKKRYSSNALPNVHIVDMTVERELGNRGNLSRALADAIRENLANGEQSMLLLNRRGYHTYLNCLKCGEVYSCPNCSIPLTYHKANGSLVCHYCGYAERFTGKCKKCGSGFIYSSGTGTQRIEDELAQLFPSARVLRMDADTTMNKNAYEKNFTAFKNKEYDIMVGTQMIAKGLDFENVTLVGVLLIDKSLYAGDYLGYENTFSLITQVVGRSGRGEKKGRAFLQTFSPDHYVLNLAAKQDYETFSTQELEIRKALLFPPYCDICLAGFSSINESECERAAAKFLDIFAEKVKNTDIPIRVLGPSKCSVAKINGKFRYRMIIKCKNNKKFRQIMHECLLEAYSKLPKVSFYLDMNGEII